MGFRRVGGSIPPQWQGIFCVFDVDNALLESEELSQFLEGPSARWGIGSHVNHSGLYVVEHERTRVSEEVGVPHLHLLPKTTEYLVDLKVFMQHGCVVRSPVAIRSSNM